MWHLGRQGVVIRKRVMAQAMVVVEPPSTPSTENIRNFLEFTVSWSRLVDHKRRSQIVGGNRYLWHRAWGRKQI